MPAAEASTSPCSLVFRDAEAPDIGVHLVMVSRVEVRPRCEDGRLLIIRAQVARVAGLARKIHGHAPFLGSSDVFSFLHESNQFAPVLREFAGTLQEIALEPHWGL